ncbi:hypothetical protein HYU13_06755 [Candidatus Woesearchaeota archaeon]|nr:hypothetical protein [Candidatus Woesearchaeota archaeon]
MQQSSQETVNKPLQFTGNWFIDAGILGFVNLMEEVYGWDLESDKWAHPNYEKEMLGFTPSFKEFHSVKKEVEDKLIKIYRPSA